MRTGHCVIPAVLASLAIVSLPQRASAATLTGLPVAAGAVAVTNQADTTDDAIEQALRTEFATIAESVIRTLFGDLRVALGLSRDPMDPASDPLALVETVVTGAVQRRISP